MNSMAMDISKMGQAWSILAQTYLFMDRDISLTKKRKVDDTKSERDSDI